MNKDDDPVGPPRLPDPAPAIRPTPANPTPGLSREVAEGGQAVQPPIEMSIGAHDGSVVIDWGTPRAWLALDPEAIPSVLSALATAAIEAQKQIREEQILAKRRAEQARKVSDEW